MANDDRTKIIPRRTPESAATSASVKRAMAITANLNRLTFNDANEVRALSSDLIGKKVDDSFILVPPFYTTGGSVGAAHIDNICAPQFTVDAAPTEHVQGSVSRFVPLSRAKMAIAWPWPSWKSAFSQLTMAPAFTPGASLPFCVNPFFSASARKSAGLLPVFA
jgi:hypothetical protein